MATVSSIIDTLQNSEVFGCLEASHLENIAAICCEESHRSGASIFMNGDNATKLYILTDGKVALQIDVRPVPDYPGIPTTLEVVDKGGTLGWSAFVKPYVYTLSARCMTNCRVLAIKGDLLQRSMIDDPRLGYEVMSRLAELIALRLAHTRLRLVSGIGIGLTNQELKDH